MKKFLALVLALVMTMSLVTISAGAEFTDADSVNYDEAVEVMTALEVVGGYADGSFNPTAGLTRGAAAKIICNMLLGPTTAEALVCNEAPYADVAVDNVFAGYIAYCANEGIISGYADGTFKPAAPLTGYAFMKMLLGALGYDATNEGYVGSNWSINVAKRALNIGLDAGLTGDFSGAKALTREEACLYAFNALKATMVEYKNDSKITVGDIVISNSSKAEEVTRTEDGTVVVNYAGHVAGTAGIGTLQFCEKYFKDLTKVSGDADDFGRDASHKWQLDGEDVFNVVKTPSVVFTANTKAADVAKALKGYTFHTKIVDKDTPVGSSYATDIGELSFTSAATKIADAISYETGNGVLVEIYAGSDKVVTDVVVVPYTVAEVLKITTNKDGDVTYKIGSITKVDFADDEYKDDTIVIEGDIAVGDIVTYTVEGANNVAYVYPTTSFVGTQTATKTATVGLHSVQTITIDGAAYEVAHVSGVGSVANQKEAYKYFVDQYGFVVETTSTDVASTDYAMVVGLDAKVETSFGSTTPTLKARVVLADGTVGVYTVALTEGEGTDAGKFWVENVGSASNYLTLDTAATVVNTALVDLGMADAADGVIDNKAVFGYTLEGDVITFEKLDTLPTNTNPTADNTVYSTVIAELTKATKYDQETDKDVLVDGNTIFVAYNTTDKDAVVYAGLKALPSTITSSNEAGYAVLKTGTAANIGYANVIFFETATGVAAANTDDLVFVATGYTTKIVDGKDKLFYTAYKADGSTFEVEGNATTLGGYLYAPKSDNTITSSEKKMNAQNALIIDQAALTVDGDMVLSGSNWYNITADTDIVYVDSTLSEVDANQGIIILVKDTNDVDVLYVVAD